MMKPVIRKMTIRRRETSRNLINKVCIIERGTQKNIKGISKAAKNAIMKNLFPKTNSLNAGIIVIKSES